VSETGTTGRNLPPADELAEIRAEIRRLKAREAELREALLETGGADGLNWHVTIVEQRRRTLDREALPAAILDDPRYWKDSVSRIVKTVPKEGGAPEAAGPGLIDDDDRW